MGLWLTLCIFLVAVTVSWVLVIKCYYDYRQDQQCKNDLQLKNPEIAEDLKRKFYAYIQEVTYAISQDKICHDIDLK